MNKDRYAKQFYEKVRNSHKTVTYVQGQSEIRSGDQYTLFTGHKESETNDATLLVTSSLGCTSTGLNLTNIKVMFVQPNCYQPISASWYEQKGQYKQAQTDDVVNTILQNLGRMTRKSLEEQEGGSVSKRILIMSGQMNVPGLMELVKNEAEQNYKRVDVIDLDEHLNAFKHYKEPKRSERIREEIQKVLAQLFQWVTDPNLEPPLPTFDAPNTIQKVLKERMEEMFIECDGTLPTWRNVYRKMSLNRLKSNKHITEPDILELKGFFDELTTKHTKA